MQSVKLFSITLLFLSLYHFTTAQETKKESFKVSGNCGMCKNTIEKAAKAAGAEYAEWNKETKELTIRYSSTSTNAAKVQQKIAAAGYDTPSVKATEEAYNGLPQCCHYERMSKKEAGCCENGVCAKGEKECKEMGCCTAEKCEKCEKGEKGTKDNTVMDCCKNSQCEKHS